MKDKGLTRRSLLLTTVAAAALTGLPKIVSAEVPSKKEERPSREDLAREVSKLMKKQNTMVQYSHSEEPNCYSTSYIRWDDFLDDDADHAGVVPYRKLEEIRRRLLEEEDTDHSNSYSTMFVCENEDF